MVGFGNKENHTLDKQFIRNFNECKKLGIPVGVYVYNYASSQKAIKSGAEWTVKQLKGLSLELPVYLDMEDSSIKSCGKSNLTKLCKVFNTIIEKDNRWAGVYANLDWFTNYLDNKEIRKLYTCWIAHYTSGINKYEGNYDIWQNSSTGKITGISGNIDTNYMYRNLVKEITGKNISGNSTSQTPVTSNIITYIVKQGDTLSRIAQKFNTTYLKIAQDNNIKNPNLIFTGQVLKIRK